MLWIFINLIKIIIKAFKSDLIIFFIKTIACEFLNLFFKIFTICLTYKVNLMINSKRIFLEFFSKAKFKINKKCKLRFKNWV